MNKLDWCPEHTDSPDGCPYCDWLSTRQCGCEPGIYCPRCNRVSMMAVRTREGANGREGKNR